jgi:hypothetical protein
MEATYSSEMSVGFQRTTRRYIPEERALHNHLYENLKSYIIQRIWSKIKFDLQISVQIWTEIYQHPFAPTLFIFCTLYKELITLLAAGCVSFAG